MKKSFTPILIVLVIASIIAVMFISMSNVQNMTVVSQGNLQQIPLKITLGKYQDSDCGMVIDNLTDSSQVVSKDGKTWFFHDHGGMVHWLETKNFKDDTIIWVHSRDTKKWIDGRKAWYSRTDETPMRYGFGAYEIKQSHLIDFDTMRIYTLRGENLRNPVIRKQLLGNKGT